MVKKSVDSIRKTPQDEYKQWFLIRGIQEECPSMLQANSWYMPQVKRTLYRMQGLILICA